MDMSNTASYLNSNLGGMNSTGAHAHMSNQLALINNIESGDVDGTVQAFAQWLTEMKMNGNNCMNHVTSEMGIIRDGITANYTNLTEYKRHSTSIQQQMQSQLTDLREKLTAAFGEITSLVKARHLSVS
eukprot:Platyproteum_vivax@DN3143_c0_g1_i2.p1